MHTCVHACMSVYVFVYVYGCILLCMVHTVIQGVHVMYRVLVLDGLGYEIISCLYVYSMQAAVAAFRLSQFTRYHKRWLADSVQVEEEESCNQWLLHQSPEMTTVREAEEYRPGRVRYRYITGMGLLVEVQSEKVSAQTVSNEILMMYL